MNQRDLPTGAVSNPAYGFPAVKEVKRGKMPAAVAAQARSGLNLQDFRVATSALTGLHQWLPGSKIVKPRLGLDVRPGQFHFIFFVRAYKISHVCHTAGRGRCMARTYWGRWKGENWVWITRVVGGKKESIVGLPATGSQFGLWEAVYATVMGAFSCAIVRMREKSNQITATHCGTN